MKVIVGLGNPGSEYINTRHNLGFKVVDKFAQNFGLAKHWQQESKFKAETIKTNDFVLAKPKTFMNNSGQAVSSIVNFYKLVPSDVIVAYDELDLPVGKIKIRQGGSAAGHHGIESIIAVLGSDQFIRVRLGINDTDAVSGEIHRLVNSDKFVISKFEDSELPRVEEMINKAAKVVEYILKEGVEKTQNRFHFNESDK